jgi:hypothetical protein
VIALVAWGWALIGIVAFVALGLLVALLLGAAGIGGDFARGFAQTVSMRRSVYRGVELPDEVPEPPLDEDQAPAEQGPRQLPR